MSQQWRQMLQQRSDARVWSKRRASRGITPSASPLPTPPGTPRGAVGAGGADLGVLSDRLNRLAVPRSAATPSTAHKSAFGRALTPPTATPAPSKVRIGGGVLSCVPASTTAHVQRMDVSRHRAPFGGAKCAQTSASDHTRWLWSSSDIMTGFIGHAGSWDPAGGQRDEPRWAPHRHANATARHPVQQPQGLGRGEVNGGTLTSCVANESSNTQPVCGTT